jgi:uncharacterized spore protein YtfJ
MAEKTQATDAAVASVQSTMDTFIRTGHVDHVYGDPIQHGDTTIIPAAEVLVGMGFAAGFGSGEAEAGDGGGGGGGGGGGRTLSRPVAVIIAAPEGVRVEPVIDPTKIALAALTAAGFMMATMLRMASPKRALKNLTAE